MQIKSEIRCLTDAEILRQWLDSVPRGEYVKVKSRIREVCLISKPTFANWIYGRCRIPEAGKRDINKVAQEVSGKEIFTITTPDK